MSRVEISGYVQIVIGIVGIVLTLLTAPTILDAVGAVSSGGGMPADFAGASGAIRIFAVLTILFVLGLLVVLGAAITLSTLFRALGAHHPVVAAFGITCGTLALAVTATLAILGIRFWVAGFVGTLGLFVVGVVACKDEPELQGVGIAALIGLALFLITGLGTLITSPVTSSTL
jgi:hypothetical protein